MVQGPGPGAFIENVDPVSRDFSVKSGIQCLGISCKKPTQKGGTSPYVLICWVPPRDFVTPKVRLAAKNTPFLQKRSMTSYVKKKTTLFYAFCVRGCVASARGEWPPLAIQ